MADHASLLPPNASQLQRDIEQTVATYLAGWPMAQIKNAHNPRLCRADFLPFLGWEWSVETWDANWPEATQRDVVWTSPEVHRRKGTIGAVRVALAAMGYGDVSIHEGVHEVVFDGFAFDTGAAFTEPLAWYEYTVTLAQPISTEMINQIEARLGEVAAERSVLVRVKADLINVVFDGFAFDAGQSFDAVINFEGGYGV